MELFILKAEGSEIRAIDLAHPEFCFVFEDIRLGEDGWSATSSVLKSVAVEQSKYNDPEEVELDLDSHADRVFEELLRAIETQES